MGISIEVHSEVKMNGIWCHYSAGSFDRDYRLFHKLAGVRTPEGCTDAPISKPKGLPEDASYITRLMAQHRALIGVPVKDVSWLSSEEINEVEEWYRNNVNHTIALSYQIGGLFGCSFANFHPSELSDERNEIPPVVQDIRWIFWFE
jgi:hypothetical protein